MAWASQKRKRASGENILPTPQPKHPYLTGNFAPIHQTTPLTPCVYIGRIPDELADGQYVRNGSNPVSNDDLGRDAHWFDGDGMLTGVSFVRDASTGIVKPEFVNQFVLTDVYLNTLSSPRITVPILPSIATLVNPVLGFILVTLRILRTLLLVVLSHLPGSKQPIKKISVANTNILYHDGRALATCESGPPMRIQLPGLETVGWYNGAFAEGEPATDIDTNQDVLGGGSGLISFMREWTTAHPKVDPITKEMLLYHSSFAPPYVQYSILPPATTSTPDAELSGKSTRTLNAGVPGVSGAKMMHDFGVSSTHTIIMDLPLSLDPLNQLKGLPPVKYDSSKPSRFGVFPRHEPSNVQWFETDACCIFHTANTWDSVNVEGNPQVVNMLACRLTSATLIYAAGNIAPPIETKQRAAASGKRRMPFFSKYNQYVEDVYIGATVESPGEEKDALFHLPYRDEPGEEFDALFNEDQCRLYYYGFDLESQTIKHQWALSAIPFEFPSVRPDLEMQQARYVYGCSTTTTDFGSALGKATKIDALVKVDARALITRGLRRPPPSVTGVVDHRNMAEVLAANDKQDPIQVFVLPEGWYAQEPRFVPAATNQSEDDGYLLFYAFDERQLNAQGDIPADDSPLRARSELWIINASNMKQVVARVILPQRVPYGLHGAWFSSEQIKNQRPVDTIRTTATALEPKDTGLWMNVRDLIERTLG